MTKIKNDSIFISILLMISGAVIALFPDLISKIFTLIGVAVIVYNVVKLILVLSDNKNPVSSFKAFAGIFLGFLIIILPTLLEFSIPVIIGVFLAFTAANKILAAIELKNHSKQWIPSLIIGIILALCALFFIFNPFAVSFLFKRVIGIILIVTGIMILLSAYSKNSKSSDSNSSVIDISSFSVHDDDNYLK